ncbi:MAG TPA: FapA family protein [Spirochaetota bacterium]|nr:FapA family protein [Spirochaetota bacterium]HPF06144.1 FapA family protein [Spirochaetota bacterium]HPJ41318.1 FapA family protein [Spirochaetota bacterium]HPR37053.1 FapA family protein [Spirochaetota bacterium]HRX46673.1 FapA family protein [Spirochaetota bacterium]
MKKIIFYFEPSVQGILAKKKNAAGEVKTVLSSKYNFVSENEIVARVIDVQDESDIPSLIDAGYEYYNVQNYSSISTGRGIRFDDTLKAYVSSYYGFVIIKDGKIQLLSPLAYSKDKINAYYYIYPTKSGVYPSYREVHDILHVEKIVYPVSREKFEKQIDAFDKEHPQLARVIVAEGKAPVNGYDEYYEPLLSLEKKVGKVLADGRIDYKEQDSIIQVQKNQEVLQRIPEVKPEDGYDVFGEVVSAEREEKGGLKRGENIVQSGFDESIFLSGIDGCLNISNNKVSVMPVAVIQGDVDLDSGNIQFNGTVRITGSVKSGFKVQADNDIIVEGDVDNAQLISGGSITVKMGVVGKDGTRLIAKGDISAKFIQNAKVEAGKSVIVSDSIINCDILSYDKIEITGKNGKIIGGKLVALYEIKSPIVGTQTETVTNLTVGRNFAVEEELNKKRGEIKIARDRIEEITTSIKMQFGEEIFKNPKEYIKILPSLKKQTCLVLLNDLGKANASLQKLLEESWGIEARLKLEREPAVVVRGRIFPGSIVNVKKSVRKIETPLDNVKLYEDPEDKSVRFISAI